MNENEVMVNEATVEEQQRGFLGGLVSAEGLVAFGSAVFAVVTGKLVCDYVIEPAMNRFGAQIQQERAKAKLMQQQAAKMAQAAQTQQYTDTDFREV